MRLIKATITLACEEIETRILRSLNRECWLAEGTGLACTAYGGEDRVAFLGKCDGKCDQWVFTHVKSGMRVGLPFPADKQIAHILLEELGREGLDFTADQWAIRADKSRPQKLRNAWTRAEKRCPALRGAPEVQQLSLFGEVS